MKRCILILALIAGLPAGCGGESDKPAGDAKVERSQPTVAGASRLDGSYEYTTTKDDLRRVGVNDVVLENYGHHRWTFRDGHFRDDQDNGPTCQTFTTGTFAVRGQTLTFRVEHAGGRAPHGTGPKSWLAKPGEMWTFRWSLYRNTLALHPVQGAVSPEPLFAQPWRKTT